MDNCTNKTSRRTNAAFIDSASIRFYNTSRMHYLLFYDLAADYLERRGAFRPEHLALAWQAQARGDLVLAGALADPVDGAVLLFQGASAGARRRGVMASAALDNGRGRRS